MISIFNNLLNFHSLKKLLPIIILYIIFINIFAIIYCIQYKDNPSSFIVNSDIVNTEEKNMAQELLRLKAINCKLDTIVKHFKTSSILDEDIKYFIEKMKTYFYLKNTNPEFRYEIKNRKLKNALSYEHLKINVMQNDEFIDIIKSVKIIRNFGLSSKYLIFDLKLTNDSLKLFYSNILYYNYFITPFDIFKNENKYVQRPIKKLFISNKDTSIYIYDEKSNIFNYNIYNINERAHNIKNDIIKDLNIEIKRNDNEIKQILYNKESKILNYLDFVYYSTITISTTGFGDILPNNRIIRLITTLEILLGLFFVSYAFAIFADIIKKGI